MAASLAVRQQRSTALKILIVEDEGLIAAHISSLLKKGGYEVAGVAESSEEALENASKSKPDLILMDIRIKGEMDGIQVAQKIREDWDIPVIFLTSHTDQETIERAKMASSAGFLSKPIHATTLSTAIEMGILGYSAERALRCEEAWMATLLATLPDAIAIFDRTGRIRHLNPAAEQLTGWRQEAAVNDHISKILPLTRIASGSSADDLYSIALQATSAVSLAEGLSAGRRSGGSFLIDGQVLPSVFDGKVVGAVLTFRDAGGTPEKQDG